MSESEFYQTERYHNEADPANGIATACFIFGILSLGLLITGVGGMASGALGLLLGLLSRRTGSPLHPKAKKGLIFSGIGFVIGTILVAYSVIYLFQNPAIFQQTMEQYYQQMMNL